MILQLDDWNWLLVAIKHEILEHDDNCVTLNINNNWLTKFMAVPYRIIVKLFIPL